MSITASIPIVPAPTPEPIPPAIDDTADSSADPNIVLEDDVEGDDDT